MKRRRRVGEGWHCKGKSGRKRGPRGGAGGAEGGGGVQSCQTRDSAPACALLVYKTPPWPNSPDTIPSPPPYWWSANRSPTSLPATALHDGDDFHVVAGKYQCQYQLQVSIYSLIIRHRFRQDTSLALRVDLFAIQQLGAVALP